MSAAPATLESPNTYMRCLMSYMSREELKRSLYAAVRLAYAVLGDDWTGSEESLRSLIISDLDIDEDMFDEAVKE